MGQNQYTTVTGEALLVRGPDAIDEHQQRNRASTSNEGDVEIR